MMLDIKYEFGTMVYLKTDTDQQSYIITGMDIRPGNLILYELSQGTRTSDHYDFEFTLEKDVVKATTG